ncbi:penicillin-binding protein [Pullulanibacillus pueri]|uniref:Carboxypeptidase n=1 Tax=Pullulanibacillus pueri TaxID=1437324 RepID=A0A8J2ZZ92_9BACL|nr:transglycosylase domain-containing protein [Pullulanibacillus pueri]MBM7683968.1 penicillin-binding protein [Pullulanibacillus pueri]GGH88108.1 carboxypeptidase [Pullulanibacillus pueri]
MDFHPKQLWNQIKRGIQWLNEKKVFRSLRVGYKVTWNLFLIIISIVIIGGFFAGGVAAGYFASLVKDQPILSYSTLKKDITNYSETSTIYFADNKPLGRMQTDLIRTDVSLKDVSPLYIHALLATEDQLFYEHDGVVPKSVFRAVFQELTNQPIVTGGSTITQQLVKNQILTNEVSFDRKAKEILLSLRLERFFSKDDILQAYINVIPFGRNSSGENIAGIEAAAKGIFNVDAKDLNLPQAAFIAGIPKNPFVYSPFENSGGQKEDISSGVNRAHTVLKNMLDAKYITNAEYKKALKYDYKKHFAKATERSSSQYPYLMEDIRERASEKLAIIAANKDGYDGNKLQSDANTLENLQWLANVKGYSLEKAAKNAGLDYKKAKKNADLYNEYFDNAEKQLNQDGYKIHTTINKDIYDKMRQAADHSSAYEKDKVFETIDENGKKQELRFPMEVGSILIQNDTGAIISYVAGRRDEAYKYSKVNHATQTIRQNGSTMKPLLDYAPAIENGLLSPGTILADLPTSYPTSDPNNPYTPHNYGEAGNGLFHGLETARKALAESHNVPAIETYFMNRQHFQPINYLQKMGFSSLIFPNDKQALSVGIGGLTRGVTVEENANAYTTFANGGNFVDAYMIDKITTNDGKVVYQHQTKPTKVFSPQTAYITLDMMRDVMRSGTAADVPGRLKFQSDWYGKTGTSQDWHDGWFVASNPNITLGIWTGFDQQLVKVNGAYTSLELNHSLYHQTQSQLWASFANAAYDVDPKLMAPNKSFKMPEGVAKKTFCGLTNGPLTDSCKSAGYSVTDLVNTKYLPDGKGTVSYGKGSYVLINNKKYQALSSTPSEFTHEGGSFLDTDFLKQRFPHLITSKIKTSLGSGMSSVSTFNADSKAPNSPGGLAFKNGVLSWSKSSSNDVVGYYVYGATGNSNSFKKLSSIGADHSLQLKAPSGYNKFYVLSVDITGRTSKASNVVDVGKENDKKEKADQDKTAKTDENQSDSQDKSKQPTHDDKDLADHSEQQKKDNK